MSDVSPETILTGGGLTAFAMSLVYAGRLGLEWWKAKRDTDTAATMTPVTNAAAAQEVLLSTLQAVRDDREDTRKRLTEVESRLENAEGALRKERMIRERQSKRIDEHDQEIGHIKRQFVLAVSYIRSLLAFIGDRGLTNEAPKPPDDLHID